MESTQEDRIQGKLAPQSVIEGEKQLPDKNFRLNEDNKRAPEEEGKYRVDSAYAWLMVLSGFLLNFITFGTLSIYGVFLAHYTKFEFVGEGGNFLSIIGGVGPCLFALSSLPSGILVAKLGFRFNIFSAVLLFSGGLIAASFGKALWHILIGQAILVGASVGLCFIPSVSIVPQWFVKYRGLAVGLTASGSGVGGLVLAPLMQSIIDSLGWRWALRILAIIGAVVISFAGVILKQRVAFQQPKQLVDRDILTDLRFIAMWMYGVTACFGFWAPFFIIPLYCNYQGISPTTASVIVGVMNAGSAVGRVGNGQIASYFGNINTLLVSHLLASLSFLLVWNFATQVWSIAIFALLYGLFSSAFFPVSTLIAAQLFGLEKLAKVNGPFFTCCAPGNLLCTFIVTLIVAKHTDGSYINYFPCFVYLFGCYLASTICLIWLRFYVSRELWAKV
jgi:MFS family permease